MSSRLYKLVVAAVDKRVPQIARPFWEYEAGPKTIFFVKKNTFLNLLATFFVWVQKRQKVFNKSDDYVVFDRESRFYVLCLSMSMCG